jgi:hypothetical protein
MLDRLFMLENITVGRVRLFIPAELSPAMSLHVPVQITASTVVSSEVLG